MVKRKRLYRISKRIKGRFREIGRVRADTAERAKEIYARDAKVNSTKRYRARRL